MHSHLVSIEVGVERGTYQWMKLDCLTFYQDWLKCLNTKSVKRRGTVQHNWMLFDYILQYIPYFWLQRLNLLLCCLYVCSNTTCCQFFHYERLEQLDCHFLWKSTLINLQLRTNYDNGTSGIVNTLTKKVLTETSLLTL